GAVAPGRLVAPLGGAPRAAGRLAGGPAAAAGGHTALAVLDGAVGWVLPPRGAALGAGRRRPLAQTVRPAPGRATPAPRPPAPARRPPGPPRRGRPGDPACRSPSARIGSASSVLRPPGGRALDLPPRRGPGLVPGVGRGRRHHAGPRAGRPAAASPAAAHGGPRGRRAAAAVRGGPGGAGAAPPGGAGGSPRPPGPRP